MSTVEFVNRENEILRTLSMLAEKDANLVVVGGYAVSGLGKHRFSVDCDIVILKADLPCIQEILDHNGYQLDIEKSGFDETYAGEFIRYKKAVGALPITFDLLVGSLMCRTTGACWSFDYIRKYSIEGNINGIEYLAKSRVPEKELMIAFKIHSGRRTDVRDIVMLIENCAIDRLLIHLKRGNIETLKSQIEEIKRMLNDEKLVDSLKGVFNLTSDVQKEIGNARKKIQLLSEELAK